MKIVCGQIVRSRRVDLPNFLLAIVEKTGQTGVPMNMRAAMFLLLVAAFGGAFWFSGPVSATEKKTMARQDNNVVFKSLGHEKMQIILPGTTLSREDETAVNKILNQYDKTLFRIDTYENGKRGRPRGKLTDVITNKRLASELAETVKTPGFSQFALQICGWDDNPTFTPTPQPHAGPPGAANNPTVVDNKMRLMFGRLELILKKYQRK